MKPSLVIASALISLIVSLSACNTAEAPSDGASEVPPAASVTPPVQTDAENTEYKQQLEDQVRENSADWMNAVASVDITGLTLEYLSERAIPSYEGAFFSLAPVADCLYVDTGLGLEIYKNGIYCGGFSPLLEFPQPNPPFDESWSDFESIGSLGLVSMHASGKLFEEIRRDTYTSYVFEVNTPIYSMGDHERLSLLDILTEAEAGEKKEHAFVAAFGNPGSYAYTLDLNRAFVSEDDLHALLDAFSFSGDAFSDEVFAAFSSKQREMEEQPELSDVQNLLDWVRGFPLLSDDYRCAMEEINHTYRVIFDGLAISVPDGTVGIKTGDAAWNLYGVGTLPYAAPVGQMTAESPTDVQNPADAVKRYTGGAYHETLLQNLGNRYYYSYTYEADLFNESQNARLSERVQDWSSPRQWRVRTIVLNQALTAAIILDYADGHWGA